ncbi:polysaccharide deacetylase family protein [Mesorhizobium sp. LHD-90]|uniref:polysaccharide deacetylase family protein n=1 Tax=Mesorhizobium sp. LHD-90 TaxID=3071414 RepID=UPI0027DEF4A6|nr:polysaccharide deacetylase family protein [Mesorhizobium sp. LHD-90]MDQ6435190.1 polysaccharide deacetylase family protein [Mesorhizobium sp. LHD-90]
MRDAPNTWNLLRLLALMLTLLAAGLAPSAAAERTIYLTFDDGPLPGTANVLDVLESEDVPATMFLVGLHVEAGAERRALLKRAKSMPLVTVGNHSYSHARNRYKDYYSDTEAVVADMQRANGVLGLTPWVNARMPGRDVFRLRKTFKEDISVNAAQYEREAVDFDFVSASGFLLYGWDFEWVHKDSGEPVQSVERLVSEIDHLFRFNRFTRRGKMILLMHDQMFQDRFDGKANLTALIRALKSSGYAFGDIRTYEQ